MALSLVGLEGTTVLVECQISGGLPALHLVGLPDASLNESVARVRAAIAAISLAMPPSRVTVNLSPASIPKSGSGYDLAIAASLLVAMDKAPRTSVEQSFHLGELGLDGSLRPVQGVLATVAAIRAVQPEAWILVPQANLIEASLVPGGKVYGLRHLKDLVGFHRLPAVEKEQAAASQLANVLSEGGATPKPSDLDYAQVLGQPDAVWACTVAAAGGHNLLMVGPPGAGKTMLAERLPSILPSLSLQEAIATTAVHSLKFARDNNSPLIDTPPFIAPHHSASMAALVGGGSRQPQPGAISLAHNGVLFLDEATEFSATVLDSLRQPLESGQVTVARSGASATFPARFQLVMAANPCGCGYRDQGGSRRCTCPAAVISRYQSKLSGPLLDRVDIQLRITKASMNANFVSGVAGPTSAELRLRVAEARERASMRFQDCDWRLNAHAPATWIRQHFAEQRKALAPLRNQLVRGDVSMRGFVKVLRVALTLADLKGEATCSAETIAEASQLRNPNLVRYAHAS